MLVVALIGDFPLQSILRFYRDLRGLSVGVVASDFFESGDYPSAVLSFTKAIALNPDYADAYYNRGLGYVYSGQYDKALNDWDKAIELNPNHSSAINNRKILLERHPELKP